MVGIFNNTILGYHLIACPDRKGMKFYPAILMVLKIAILHDAFKPMVLDCKALILGLKRLAIQDLGMVWYYYLLGLG